jgi:outer membrane biosynthesis protein TonB
VTARTRARLVLLAALAAPSCLTKEAPRETPPSAPEAPPPPAVTPPPPPAPPEGEASEAPARDTSQKKPSSQALPRKAAPAPSPAAPEGAGAPKASAESKRALDRDDAAARANALMQQLRSTPSQPTADCPAAREQRATICALADRICRMVDRDPNVASIADYCSEARQRCADAGRRTAERCD